jgi:HEAT repeat protein
MPFRSLCQIAHKTLIAGKCPWCGHTIIDGQDLQVSAVDDIQITEFTEDKPDPKKAIPQLLVFLRHANAEVRKQAATILGQIGPDAKESLPALSLLLQDKDQLVRDAAQEAIKRIEG